MEDLTPYERYLRLPELLALQTPTASRAEDIDIRDSERLFIVVHQASELLAQQVLCDLRVAATEMSGPAPQTHKSSFSIERAAGLIRLIGDLLGGLDHLPREHFLAMRDGGGDASACQSRQFADIFRLTRALTEPESASRPLSEGTGDSLGACLVRLRDAVAAWKVAHCALAERMIGEDSGTGGSSGVAYLRSRLPGSTQSGTGGAR